MTTQTDKDDWERFVQTIKPLKGKADRYVDSVPPRLIVRKAPPKRCYMNWIYMEQR